MDEILDLLDQAFRTKRVVRVTCEIGPDRPEGHCGFVCGLSESLLLLHYISDSIELDGYTVLRVSDIVDVTFDFISAGFYRRALQLKNQLPRELPGVVLSSMRELILWADQHYPVVVLHREELYPDECEIGRIKMATEKSYTLTYLSPAAEWEHHDSFGKFDDITSVQFDGRYENTLVMVAESEAAKRKAPETPEQRDDLSK